MHLVFLSATKKMGVSSVVAGCYRVQGEDKRRERRQKAKATERQQREYTRPWLVGAAGVGVWEEGEWDEALESMDVL